MEKITKLVLSQLRNNEHFQFMTDVKNAMETATPASLNMETVFPEFISTYNDLNSALLVDQGSVKTEQLSALDELRDRTWSALGERIRATLICPVEAEAESAKALKRVFDLYGSIREMSYNEETAALTNLIEDLVKPKNAEHCNVLGMLHWVDALKQQNNDFQSLLDARNTELANKESGDVKAARDGIDPVYERIVERANALAELEMASTELQAFIRELNQRIKYYKETLVVRSGRKSGDEDVPVDPAED
jgi:uncharacterized coiled-coil DUF342 family protein